MIAKTSKCSKEILQHVAGFIYGDKEFQIRNFAGCTSETEIARILAVSNVWYVQANDRPTALFKLGTFGSNATISEICFNGENTVGTICSTMREDLRKTGIGEIAIRVPQEDEGALGPIGFKRRDSYVRFSRVPSEIRMMPILPLMNITQKEIQVLSQLLFDAYSKSAYGLPDVQSAEKQLRSVMSGGEGKYLSNASFASGAYPNLVSACLITEQSPGEATITQMFTHPLYRARGLATTEITSGMNRLLGSGFRHLAAWNSESNTVVTRLLTKMEFKEDRRVAEYVSSI
jgi:hypothetical protein